MTRSSQIILSLISLLLANTAPASSSSSSRRNANNIGGGGASFSPIKELGPSLAASVAGGTVIAVRSPTPSRPSSSCVKNEGANVRETQLQLLESARKVEEEEEEEELIVVLFRSPSFPTGSASRSHTHSIHGDAGRNLTVASVFGRSHKNEEEEENCVKSNECSNNNNNNNPYQHLTFLPNGPVQFPTTISASSSSSTNQNSNNQRILHAPSGLFLAATGFAPDAHHILQVAAGRVLSRISVYDAPSSVGLNSSAGGRSGKSIDPHRLVREDLSSIMMDASMSEGGRPLGVQLLVIGQSALSPSRRIKSNSDSIMRSLEIYTIDPSGGWRSWCGRGTAIGRGAERVRASLVRLFSSGGNKGGSALINSGGGSGWKSALDNAMTAAIDALEMDQDTETNIVGAKVGVSEECNNGNYGAVVIFGGSRGRYSNCAVVDPAFLEDCYRRCVCTVKEQKRQNQLACKVGLEHAAKGLC